VYGTATHTTRETELDGEVTFLKEDAIRYVCHGIYLGKVWGKDVDLVDTATGGWFAAGVWCKQLYTRHIILQIQSFSLEL